MTVKENSPRNSIPTGFIFLMKLVKILYISPWTKDTNLNSLLISTKMLVLRFLKCFYFRHALWNGYDLGSLS